MNIIIILFIITSIIIAMCLKKLNMIVASNLYLLISIIILLINLYTSDSEVIRSIIKVCMPYSLSDYIYFALNDNNCAFSYLVVLTFITIIQVVISIIIIEKRLLSSKHKESYESTSIETNNNKKILIHKEKVEDNHLSLNKVYKNLCKMLN